MPTPIQNAGPYTLSALPYDYADLAPVIDEQTMRLHHDKHHQAYVDAVNKALAPHPEWVGLPIEEVLRRLPELPADIRTAVRNQGGGHANHAAFWQMLTPHGADGPSGELAQVLARSFGSIDAFRTQFEEAGARHFGSGWTVLAADPADRGKLEILTLPNQDSMLSAGKQPLLLCDLWEHAYYLRYNNRRPEWLKAFWQVVHWEHVAELLADAGVQPDARGKAIDPRAARPA